MSIDKVAMTVNLETPKDVFRKWDPSVIWRVPLIIDVNIATSPGAPSTAL